MAASKGIGGLQVASCLNNANSQSMKTSAVQAVRHAMHVTYLAWVALIQLLVALRAIVVRVVFIGLTMASISLVVYVKRQPLYWLLLINLLPLLVDLYIATRAFVNPQGCSRSVEKWFSLCIFTYLLCTCPPIWILELHLAQTNSAMSVGSLELEPGFSSPFDQPSQPHTRTKRSQQPPDDEVEDQVEPLTTTTKPPDDGFENQGRLRARGGHVVQMAKGGHFVHLAKGGHFVHLTEPPTTTTEEPFLPPEQPLTRQALQLRIRIIEQFHLLCAIVGRWLLPLYGIGTAQLSELLLINIGTAADILDLFEAFNEEAVIKNVPLQVSILCLWQVSVLQFCFNKTARLEISRPLTVAEHPQKSSSPESGQHSLLQTSAKEGANQNFCMIGSTKKEIPPSSPMDETESQLQSPTDNVIRHSGSLHKTESQDSKKEIPQSSSLHETESQERGSESTDGGCFCGHFFRKSFIQDDQCRFVLFGTELWVIIMTLMLQDVPFMFLRLTLIFAFAVQSYQNIFFSVKNLIIIVAEVYRSSALLRTYGPNHKLIDWNHLFFRLR